MTISLSLNTSKILFLTLLGIVFSFIYLVLVPHTFAQTTSPTPTPTTREERREARIELAQVKRSAQKIKVCQTQERNITTRLAHLSDLVNNMITKFDAIAARVENRYETKLVPQGKTVSNYDSLVADINSKKATVTADLNKANSDVAGFSCTSASDPKTNLTTYRTDMQTVKTALQNYRKSIRNLIVAVATASGEKLESPEPTKTPEATQ